MVLVFLLGQSVDQLGGPIRIAQVSGQVATIGFALTSVICGLFGYVAFNNLRLSREIVARISFEDRLSAVIGELNHRVKNILAVIQSIATSPRTRPGLAPMRTTRSPRRTASSIWCVTKTIVVPVA